MMVFSLGDINSQQRQSASTYTNATELSQIIHKIYIYLLLFSCAIDSKIVCITSKVYELYSVQFSCLKKKKVHLVVK